MWLFDTLVTPTLLYGVETWEPSVNQENNWKDLERALVSMIAHTKEQRDGVSGYNPCRDGPMDHHLITLVCRKCRDLRTLTQLDHFEVLRKYQ